MKVTLLGRFPNNNILGGPRRFAVELAKNLQSISPNSDLELYCIEYFFKNIKNSTIINRLFGKEIINCSLPLIRLGLFRIVAFLRKINPDIIHIVTAERYIASILCLRFLFPGKVMITFHSSLKKELVGVKRKKVYRDLFFENISILQSDKIVFVSKLLCRLYRSLYGNKINSNVIIYNGNYPTFQKQLEEKWDKVDTFNFVFYNGFDKHIDRGLKFITGVFKELNNDRLSLHIIGNQLDFIDTDSNIHYTPLIAPEFYDDFFKDKHFLIKSDVFESFSIFALECMNNYVIPVTNANTGISEILTPNNNAFVYNSRIDLVSLLNNLLSNDLNLKQIALEGHKLAEYLTWETVAKNYCAEYKKLMNNN